MTKYLISFPSEAMVFAEEDLPAVGAAANAVIEEAKAAGVYVFGGGIDEDVASIVVTDDATVREGTVFAHAVVPNGGYTILELPSREDAVEWAAKIAVACRCPQEVREFMYDPAS